MSLNTLLEHRYYMLTSFSYIKWRWHHLTVANRLQASREMIQRAAHIFKKPNIPYSGQVSILSSPSLLSHKGSSQKLSPQRWHVECCHLCTSSQAHSTIESPLPKMPHTGRTDTFLLSVVYLIPLSCFYLVNFTAPGTSVLFQVKWNLLDILL